MKKLYAAFFAVCCLLFLVAGVFGQLRGRSWTPSPAAAANSSSNGYHWQTREDTPDQVMLFQGSRQVGAYSYTTGFYRQLFGSNWGAPVTSPIAPPLGRYGMDGGSNNFGVQLGKLSGHERYMCGNQECTEEEARGYLTGNLRDDSKDPHITAIARDSATKKKLEGDWQRLAATEKSAQHVRFQAYDASAAINQLILAPFKLDQDSKFKSAGVMLVGQAAQKAGEDFVSAARQYGYPTAAELVEFVRKTDPNYVPDKSPLPAIPGIGNIPLEWLAIAGIALAVGLVALRGRNN